jgi:signal transduction histidine kinase
MVKTADVVPEEQHFILLNLSPGRAQRRLALAVVLAFLASCFITTGPLSTLQPGRIDVIPPYATAMVVNDSITAVLLFAQFSILRSRAILVIASGYLFTALMLFPWMLTFPGVVTPAGLLGAGLQSTNWLYILWHAGFAMFVTAYALLKDANPAKRSWPGSVGAAILSSVALTAAVVCAATFLVTTGNALLPHMMLDTVRFSTLWLYAAGSMALLSVLALVVLWIRRRSVLDLWLMVVMCAYVTEFFLISYPVPARFSVGFYAGKVCGLLSGSLVLFVLLYEITRLYAQMHRESERRYSELQTALAHSNRVATMGQLAASIAHEVNQPIAATVTNAQAALRWLNAQPPDVEEVRQALRRIVNDSNRAGDVIGRIRELIKKAPPRKERVDINEAIREVLELIRGEAVKNGASVQTQLADGLPFIEGDRVELQQVLLNVVINAIEAMSGVSDGVRELLVSTGKADSGCLLVVVRDSGPGFAPHTAERVFAPFYTTKPTGLGMGLSICSSIIEAHGGRLWASANLPRGAVVQFTVPVHSDSPF